MKLAKSSELRAGEPALVAGHKGSDSVLGVRVAARREGVTWEQVLLAWLLFHPAKILPVLGTPLDDAFSLVPGDVVRLTCTWETVGWEPVLFPTGPVSTVSSIAALSLSRTRSIMGSMTSVSPTIGSFMNG